MLTQERLKELLDYDPETGIFKWKMPRKKIVPGAVAGSLDRDGYVRLKIEQGHYKAHRLAFLYVLGRWPSGEVDHIDLDKSNNKFSNLREVTKSQNMMNVPCKSHSSTGIKGVQFDARRGNYTAKITVKGQINWLGSFKSSTDAQKAYAEAVARFHGSFGRVA